jgi:putative PIN family toxin of toxin-antitoxin system
VKIVIDTNVVASAIFFGGKPRRLIELLVNRELSSYVTRDILEEYKETVEYLRNKYPEKKVSIPLTHIVSACQLIEEKTDVEVCRDPDDDKFISCAVDAECLYIVSGDKDLLALERYEGIGILTVAQFFEQVWNDD